MPHSRPHGNRVRGASSELIESARVLRREMTPAERIVWEQIRANRLNGLRFKRQYPVGQFILDFACASVRLGIEIDGSSHDGHERQDQFRDQYLEHYGWAILRFTNEDVLMSLSGVLQTIAAFVESRSTSMTSSH
jgi:very-short-patch-repair endonuclease